MKKSALLSKAILSLFTIGVLASCQNDNLNLSDQGLEEQTVSAQSVKKNSAKKYLIRVMVKTKDDVVDLVSGGIDLFGSGNGGAFDAYVTNDQANFIKSKNIKFIVSNNAVSNKAGLPTGYHTVSQVLSTVKDYSTKYSNIAKMVDIGDSWEKTKGKADNDIWALVVSGNKVKGTKSTAVFISGMHSRELLPVEVNLKFMDYLLSNYGKDPQITNFIDTREIVFVPVFNIDGRLAVEQGDSMWRKNRHIDSQYDGIDLNRNFEGHWNFEGLTLTPQLRNLKSQLEEKDSEIYSGPNAFSEPETKALNDFLKDKKVTVMMDLHAYGNMVLYAPGYDKSSAANPTTVKVAKFLASKNGYKAGTSMEVLYPTCGTSKDWGYDNFKAVAFTMEMGDDSDGFRPPFSKVEDTWKKNKEGLTYLVSIADNPAQRVK